MVSSLATQSAIKQPDASSPLVVRRRKEAGRRGTLSFLALSTAAATLPDASGSRKALLQEYLERSKQNKPKNDKERLDDYYKRNYRDYFDQVEGSVRGKKDELLSETEKGIRDWLRANK